MEGKKGVDILVVSDDVGARSLVTALISEKLGEAGFTDRKVMVDLAPVVETDHAPSLLDAMRNSNPQLFEQPVFITGVERQRVDRAGNFTTIDQSPPPDPRSFSLAWIAAVREVAKDGTVSEATKEALKAEHLNGTFVGPEINELIEKMKIHESAFQ